jgi:hypothetical protein
MGIATFPAPTTSSSATQQWTQIGAYTSTTNVSTIDFNTISQSYRSLRLAISGLVKSTEGAIYLRFNSATANNYSQWGWWQNGTTYMANTNYVDQTVLILSAIVDVNNGGYFNAIIDLPNYAEVNAAKQVSMKHRFTSPSGSHYQEWQGQWSTGASNTPAISSINLLLSTGNMFIIGSAAHGIFLYGGN